MESTTRKTLFMTNADPPKKPLRKISSGNLVDLDDDSGTDRTEDSTIATEDIDLHLTKCRLHRKRYKQSQRDSVNVAPTLIPFSERRLLTRESVTALLHDFCDDLTSNARSKSRECWSAFYEKYHSPDYLMIRPSGNPIPSSGFTDMFCTEDCQVICLKMVNVDSLQLMAAGLVAVVTYTVDQRFIYMRELHEDRVCLTCVMEEQEGEIHICHEHRSTGQPIPKGSRWDHHSCDKDPSTCSCHKSELGRASKGRPCGSIMHQRTDLFTLKSPS